MMHEQIADDWRQETQLRLERSLIYKRLKHASSQSPPGQQALALVDEATHYAYQRTKTTLRHMGQYTLHDGEHLFRVLHIMERLLPEETLAGLSEPELMLMILSAFFHDIGMAPSEWEILAWKGEFQNESPSEDENAEHQKFQRFCAARPDTQNEIDRFQLNSQHARAEILREHLISEYIRTTHAARARKILAQEWDGKICYRDADLLSDFAQLCYSHADDPLVLLDMDTDFLCGPNVFACFPFLGVLLRLADILDFDAKRTPSVLFAHLAVRDPISLIEWQKHRSVDAWVIEPRRICFQARCEHPAIEASIRAFCDLIDRELVSCHTVLSSIELRRSQESSYSLPLPPKVDRSRIGAKKDVHGDPVYLYRDAQFSLSKRQVVDLLMGTKLYGKTEVALRELLQNSLDACLVRRALEKAWGNPYRPSIVVELTQVDGEDVLRVSDNGIGMDQYIIDNYYSNIGSSFYKSVDYYELKALANIEFTPTSRFGIGILSCFMVSDSISVETRHLKGPHDSSEPIRLLIQGQDSVFWVKRGSRTSPGTETELILVPTSPWSRITGKSLVSYVETTVPNPPICIKVKAPETDVEHTGAKFRAIDPTALREYNWAEDTNVKEYKLGLNDRSLGIQGAAVVALLERLGEPTARIEVLSKEVVVDNESYSLDMTLSMGVNSIDKEFNSIQIGDNDEVRLRSSTATLAKSKSRVSLHGIEIPMDLFPESWNLKQSLRLKWPITVLLVVDISSPNDLDLNSARSEIIYNEKWLAFEEKLAKHILTCLRRKLGEGKWPLFVRAISKKDDSAFERALATVCGSKVEG